jgi:lysophospholipase L1-like esterase
VTLDNTGLLPVIDVRLAALMDPVALAEPITDPFPFSASVAALVDSAVTTNEGPYLAGSPFARAVFTTSATRLLVRGYTNIAGSYPVFAELGVVADGVYIDSVRASGNGYFSGVVFLPEDTTTLEVINGLVTNPGGGSFGTYVVAIEADAVLTPITPAVTNRTVFLVDSIGAGDSADIPTGGAYIPLLRSATTDSIIAHGWGNNSFTDMAGDASKRTTLLAELVALAPATIIDTLGTTDYGLARGSAAATEIARAALYDAIHTALPSAEIIAVTPLLRTVETANSHGDTLGAYRTAMINAASGRAWVTVLDGTSFMTTAELRDGVHPSTYGHWLWASAIDSHLGITVPDFPFGTDLLNAGPGDNGTVTEVSTDIYRAEKVGTESAWDAGFYGLPQAGDFRYQIDVPQYLDIMIGVNDVPHAEYGYSDMLKQVYLAASSSIFAYDGATSGAGLAFYAPGDRIWVDRTGTDLTFKKGAAYDTGDTLRTVSSVTGTQSLDLSIFTPGRYVDLYIEPPPLDADMTAGPDVNGTVTALGGGVERLEKTGGGAAFNAGFYGVSHAGDFRYSFDIDDFQHTMIGVSVDGDGGSGYTDMLHQIYLDQSSAIWSYNGASSLGSVGAYVAGDRVWMDRTGTTLTFKKGADYGTGTVLRTAAGVSGTVYPDLSMFTVGGILDVARAS